ncbi:MAG: TetR/AcrR family transcriptional regulator [Oscillospiraceae bacterium]|nr:TetR/AcrR family transcriptional regulator [Oscillospiraceae bacterium]
MGERQISSQSKDWIVKAFFDLLAIKPLNTITISEIAENADLDRRTFYRHFHSKEDVISFCIHEASRRFEEDISQNEIESAHTDADIIAHTSFIAKSFFDVCVKWKTMLLILHKQQLLHLLLDDLTVIFSKFHCKYHHLHTIFHEHGEDFDYVLAYYAGGFWNLLSKWLSDNCKKTPAEMASIAVNIFNLDI